MCKTTADLQRMFMSLQTHIADRHIPTNTQLRYLIAASSRYNNFTINYHFRDSPVAGQTSAILMGFGDATTTLRSLAADPPVTAPLFAPTTARNIDRALAVLGRLDCPPPIGNDTTDAPQSGLLRLSPTPEYGTNVKFPTWFRDALIVAGIFAIVTVAGIGIARLRSRKTSLAERYSCKLQTTFTGPTAREEPSSAIAEDISRSGVKLGSVRGTFPPLNSVITLKIGTSTKQLRVRWANPHFFGGQFVKPFSKSELYALLGRNISAKTRTPPKKKQRAKAAAHKKGAAPVSGPAPN